MSKVNTLIKQLSEANQQNIQVQEAVKKFTSDVMDRLTKLEDNLSHASLDARIKLLMGKERSVLQTYRQDLMRDIVEYRKEFNVKGDT